MNNRDLMEDVAEESSLRWYRMVKEEAGLEQCLRSISVGQESLRLLRTGSALMVDKKI